MEQFFKQIVIICFILIFILAIGSLIYSEAQADDDEYLQQSPIDPRKTVQYDKNGNIEGVWRKSYIDPRKRIFIPKK